MKPKKGDMFVNKRDRNDALLVMQFVGDPANTGDSVWEVFEILEGEPCWIDEAYLSRLYDHVTCVEVTGHD